MKEFLVQALNDAIVYFEKIVPQTKKRTNSISIIDVKPLDLLSFMKENDILLSWNINVPTTEKDKLEYCRRVFSTHAFKAVYKVLTENGYKRVGFNTGLLKEFDDTTVYDMYVAKDFDRLARYYSLPFIKET